MKTVLRVTALLTSMFSMMLFLVHGTQAEVQNSEAHDTSSQRLSDLKPSKAKQGDNQGSPSKTAEIS